MKLKVNPENIIVIIIVIYIIFWASNLTNNYPLKLVEICNEKLIILLVLGLLYYLVYLKKYTLAILTLIVVSFFYLNIPMLSENFIENNDIVESLTTENLGPTQENHLIKKNR